MDLIKSNPRDVSSDSKTLMQIYMRTKIFDFSKELEDTVINEFKKVLGDKQ
jgi:hypothetical protein